MDIQVAHGDALETDADVLVLKHAQATYGVDDLGASVPRCVVGLSRYLG